LQLVVFSDSHGDFDAISRVVYTHTKAGMFLHCGDGAKEASDLQALHPQKKILFVRGNCDWDPLAKDENLIIVSGKRIFFTHGHVYGVKRGLDKLIGRANSLGADIACFGHTHIPMHAKVGRLHLINPGSIGNPHAGAQPTYTTIDISSEGVMVKIVELQS